MLRAIRHINQKEPLPLGTPLGCRGNACVEVMTTLHGKSPSLQSCEGGCVLSMDTIAYTRDLFQPTLLLKQL